MRHYVTTKAPVAQWIERLFPKQKAVGSTPTWRVTKITFFLFPLEEITIIFYWL